MSTELEPLSPECAALLKPGVEAPLKEAQRAALRSRIEASFAAQLSPTIDAPAATVPAGAAGAASAGKLSAIIVASVVSGAVASRAIERQFFPPEPVVIERVQVVERLVPAAVPADPKQDPAVQVEPQPVPRLGPQKKPVVEPPPTLAPISSRERQLIEGARTALLRSDSVGALQAIAEHRSSFARGQLSEERDSLEVQALVQAERRDDARAAAARFKRSYPDSILGPAVEALVQ